MPHKENTHKFVYACQSETAAETSEWKRDNKIASKASSHWIQLHGHTHVSINFLHYFVYFVRKTLLYFNFKHWL